MSSQFYIFHSWLNLSEFWRAETFVRHMENNGVKVLQSELFAVGSVAVPQAVRVCISSPENRQQLRLALEKIKDALTSEPLEMLRPMIF